jgi:hypothetical protein
MDAYTDIQLLIVKELQHDRLTEAEARRLTRRAPRPPVHDDRARLARGWPRRVLALIAR